MTNIKVKTINGIENAQIVEKQLTSLVNYLKHNSIKTPKMSILLFGNNESSKIYVNRKINKAKAIGIDAELSHFENEVKIEDIYKFIDNINVNEDIDGVIVQLPLPNYLKEHQTSILMRINPKKDIDGLHPLNIGLLHYQNYITPYSIKEILKGENSEDQFQKIKNIAQNLQKTIPFIPCTPLGCMFLIESVMSNFQGKKAIVIGNSNLVGKPIGRLLSIYGCMILNCNTKTGINYDFLKESDIIITATGSSDLLEVNFVKDNALIIDVGINVKDGKIYGDCTFNNFLDKDCYLTPVPGGVGPMTVISLMFNTVLSSLRKLSK